MFRAKGGAAPLRTRAAGGVAEAAGTLWLTPARGFPALAMLFTASDCRRCAVKGTHPRRGAACPLGPVGRGGGWGKCLLWVLGGTEPVTGRG